MCRWSKSLQGKRSASNQGAQIRGKPAEESGAKKIEIGEAEHTCEQTFYRIVHIQASFRNLPLIRELRK
jgi:hypothetical protein